MNSPQPTSSESFQTFRTVIALMLREMSASYGRSAAGYLWAMAEPVGGIALLTFVFSLAFRAPTLGDSFALYYASGFLPLTIFLDISRKTSGAINYSKRLLFYPRVTFIDAILARVLLNSLTQFMISFIVIGTLVLINPSHLFLNIPALLLALLMAIALGFGIGSLNCYLFWRFPAWERIWGILMRPLFIASGVFFNFEAVPEQFQIYMWYNPVSQVIGQARDGIYVTYNPDYVSNIYVFGVSTIAFFFGVLLLWRYNREIVNG